MKEWRNPAGTLLSASICEQALTLAIEPLRNVAREYGHSLAVHGSLSRDIDLIAVPWVEQAGDPEKMLQDMKGAAVSIFGRARLDPSEPDEWNEKPHGRQAKSIHIYCEGHFFYFDISVMPRLPKEASADRSPEGQDASRLDAKHESAVGNAETPQPPSGASHA